MTRRACAGALVLLSCSCAVVSAAVVVLKLKDGREVPVTRLARRDGHVVFETTQGQVFSVPEADVASPPLASIPFDRAREVVLRNGQRIAVKSIVRRGSLVIFETTDGRSFSVAADLVRSPAVDSIPSADAPPPATAAAPAPAASPAPRASPPAPRTAAAPTASPPKASAPAPAAAPQPPPPIVAPPARAATEAASTTTAAPSASAAAITGLADAEFVTVPDRATLGFPVEPTVASGSLLDPYHQNVLKGDRAIAGRSVYVVLSGIADAGLERRRLPFGSSQPVAADVFRQGDQLQAFPGALVSIEVFNGQTAFRPKSWSLKLSVAASASRLDADPGPGDGVGRRTRNTGHAALEGAFAEAKLKTLSRSYDFVSLRAGIQPFVSDFRGFLFRDGNLGARVFGNADANRWQYNAAFFDLLEKDTNTGLNRLSRRGQQVLVVNAFRQDFPAEGYTLALSAHRSRDDGRVHDDANGLPVRPAPVGNAPVHTVTSNYLGLAGEGRLGRLNVSHAVYAVFGDDEHNPLAGRAQSIRGAMAAAETSIDRDWLRLKGSLFFATGDGDPSDDRAAGFDAITDAPSFAGGAFSPWIRTPIGLPGTGLLLKTSGSLLPSLRAARHEGQASFVNPGLFLVHAGADLALTTTLKVVLTASHLSFHRTAPLELLVGRAVPRPIGIDLGAGAQWRPLLNENVVVAAGAGALLRGTALETICDASPACAESRSAWSGFLSLRLSY
jgi:hypothetical protein